MSESKSAKDRGFARGRPKEGFLRKKFMFINKNFINVVLAFGGLVHSSILRKFRRTTGLQLHESGIHGLT